MELLSQEFPTAEAAGPAMLLSSLDRADYLPPPPAAAPAPTDVSHMSIGPNENAGYVDILDFLLAKHLLSNFLIKEKTID